MSELYVIAIKNEQHIRPKTISHKKDVVKLKLTENTPMVLNGNITGRIYVFRNINDLNWGDKRDVMSMKEINGLQIFY